jgi:hypothetical protein
MRVLSQLRNLSRGIFASLQSGLGPFVEIKTGSVVHLGKGLLPD